MNQDIQLDQTQFTTESPLFDDAEMTNIPKQVLSEAELKKIKQKKIKKIAIGIVVFLFIALIVFVFIKSRSLKEVEDVLKDEEVELTEIVVGPFVQRLSELKKELEIADPNQEDLPFPLIDFKISLEK